MELFSPTHTLCIQHTVKKVNLIIHLFFESGWWWSNFKGSGVLCCVEGILRDSLLCSCQAAHTVNHTMNRLNNNNSPMRGSSKLTQTYTYTAHISKQKKQKTNISSSHSKTRNMILTLNGIFQHFWKCAYLFSGKLNDKIDTHLKRYR